MLSSFIWSDGIVIAAMKSGAPLLIDEISLAEDSVLERLNPLFEEDRTLLLTDAGVEAHKVDAQRGFQIVATMNPGGDYGKKEVSMLLGKKNIFEGEHFTVTTERIVLLKFCLN